MHLFSFLITFVWTLTNVLTVNTQHIPITGVQTGVDPNTGARPFRLNILTLQQDSVSW
jgi:hypothetical protein